MRRDRISPRLNLPVQLTEAIGLAARGPERGCGTDARWGPQSAHRLPGCQSFDCPSGADEHS